jgi:hypothetical protein
MGRIVERPSIKLPLARRHTRSALFSAGCALKLASRERIAGNGAAMGEGRSLRDDPVFMALARAYADVPTASLPRRATIADLTAGNWYALLLVPGHECEAIDRVVDQTALPAYVPMLHYVTTTLSGAPRRRARAMLAGYGFIRSECRSIQAYFDRIRAFPNVLGLMREAGTETPAAIIAERDILIAQAEEDRHNQAVAAEFRRIEQQRQMQLRAAVARPQNRRKPAPARPAKVTKCWPNLLTPFANQQTFATLRVSSCRSGDRA